MTSVVNDIVKQAKQGSVAAIIQILNEELADSGVRTRAIFADGVLQLLCEAATVEQLEPTTLIQQIRQTLGAISPRNIRRVNINSRIVREQQLLWLEEINRDPKNQLLWSEEITLEKPNILQQALTDWKTPKADSTKSSLPIRSPRQLREQQQFLRGGLIGGATVALLLLAAWIGYTQLNGNQLGQTQANISASGSSSTPNPIDVSPAPSPIAVPPAEPTQSIAQSDPFADAVRIAEQASMAGQKASSSAEWLTLAARWREASELMAKVPDNDGRYSTAQQKAIEYRDKSESVLQRVQQ